MPTNRPRHVVTETDDVAHALDVAARRWPEDRARRGRLLLRLVEEGRRVVDEDERRRSAQRRRAIDETAGALTGSYAPGYLSRLRSEWPE